MDEDRNTCFYHVKAAQRRRMKITNMIKDANGYWIKDAGTMKKMFNECSHKLYIIDVETATYIQTHITLPNLEDNMVE